MIITRHRGIIIPSSFQGPGDILGTALAFWGTRAYTAASIGGNCVKLRENGSNTTQTFTTQPGGGLNLSAINTFRTSNGGTLLYVDTLYDQTGNGFDLNQTSTGFQPLFTLSGVGTLPSIDFNDANNTQVSRSSCPAQTQPYCYNAFVKHNAQASVQGIFMHFHEAYLAFNNSGTPEVFINDNGSGFPVKTLNDGTWYSVQGLYSGTNSAASVDGTAGATADAGSDALASDLSAIGKNAFINANAFNGSFTEAGIWAGDKSSLASSIKSNQHTYYGV